MNRLLERWSNFWNFIRDHIAEGSRVYRRLEIEHGIPELEEELEELRAEKEAFDSYREEDRGKLEDARNLAKHERVLRKLAEEKMAEAQQSLAIATNKLAVSMPIAPIITMLQKFQAAAILVNSDDYILGTNTEAITEIRNRLGPSYVGRTNMWELMEAKDMERLRRDIDKRRSGFRLSYGPFAGWYVGVAKAVPDEQEAIKPQSAQLYAYLLTDERAFHKRVLGKVMPLEEFFRLFKENTSEGIVVPRNDLDFKRT
jgi:hypothetical protein